ncbi:hypothetical protein AWN76_013275 [Rhodothermaceae bacterium RA]|nr:hypothetical protein AWN76_013275 [Rhodothermaceae bacterium RA]
MRPAALRLLAPAPALALALLLLTGCAAQKRLIADQHAAIDSLMALNDRYRAQIQMLEDSLQFYDDIDSGIYHRRLRQLGDRINKLEYDLAVSRDGGTTLAVLPADALFEPASARLTDAGRERLAALVDTLTGPLATYRIRVEGHSDNIPIGASLAETYPSNWELSAARAAAVVRYFLEEHDVPADRFEVVGLGPTRPVASNASAAGRRQNRRVRIAVQPAGPDTQPRAAH